MGGAGNCWDRKRYSTGKGAIFKNSFLIQYCVFKGIKAQLQYRTKLHSALHSIFIIAIPVQYITSDIKINVSKAANK